MTVAGRHVARAIGDSYDYRVRLKLLILYALVFGLSVTLSCGDAGGPMAGTIPGELVDAFPNLTFGNMTDMRAPEDGTDRIFVCEQVGRIRVFENDAATTTAPVFLDIRAQVSSGGERGLLGLAFPPDFARRGYFFVYYSPRPGTTTRLSRFKVSDADPNVADPASEQVVMSFPQAFGNHNGGGLAFDRQGHLYVGLGDEGGGGDPLGRGQDRTTLTGSILRLDVNTSDDQPPFVSVPQDNPFVGNGDGWREEIFAFGFRNPWRVTYDPVTGRVWTGDVGQLLWEEIDLVRPGRNYGWDCREGTREYTGPPDGPSDACGADGFEPPVWEYPHGDGNASVTGGYVYRGSEMPTLFGRYVFADYVSGRVWSFLYNGAPASAVEELLDAPFLISTFGTDAAGELYVCQYASVGRIYKLAEIVIAE